ncbi:MAG: hypothetical protein OMM_12804 [Candidatus Magnetoglobus multicellularis str. Araruama]|uniref:Radical SAM core domain-containing protein n=1 Tax=Candidatus Magnetoglobus multicellularis str. Araruama TaxID=890399 RepID=A0A1V1NV08_9BACT|nr:MAG: hypothetical protein OMM_12804 [Candidatus Magnetoglobus multicellularis str. Araruama]
MGFTSLLVTNGSQFEQNDIIESIISSKNLHIRISIDAYSNETHKNNHGLNESKYDSICKSIENLINEIKLSKSDVSISISHLIHKNTFDDLFLLFKAVEYWKK